MTYTVTLESIRAFKPCYDPSVYLSEDYSETLQQFLTMEVIPAKDRIWVAVRHMDDKTNRLFAVNCARSALRTLDNPDQKSIEACNVAERFAHGNATNEELREARVAARAAYYAYHAADAAYYAANAAARAASYAAAAWAAYYAAYYAASMAASMAASAAESETQCKWLIDYLNDTAEPVINGTVVVAQELINTLIKQRDQAIDEAATYFANAKRAEANLALAEAVIDVTEEWHNNPGPVPVGFQWIVNAIAACRRAKEIK